MISNQFDSKTKFQIQKSIENMNRDSQRSLTDMNLESQSRNMGQRVPSKESFGEAFAHVGHDNWTQLMDTNVANKTFGIKFHKTSRFNHEKDF